MRFPQLPITLLLIQVAQCVALAGGKHKEIMAPDSQQLDFHGKPYQVIEHCFEQAEDGKSLNQLSSRKLEFDSDGEPISDEDVDEVEKTKEIYTYQYDKDGTWVGKVEKLGNEQPKTYRIFIDKPSRRIAHVDTKTKQTEFHSYSEQGYETGTIKKDSEGKVLEQTTVKRNAANKEENVLFEENGKKTTEFLVVWSDKGFETKEEIIMHDEGGDRIVMNYDYPEVDSSGNWTVRITKQVLHQANGERATLPDEITKREIKYHP